MLEKIKVHLSYNKAKHHMYLSAQTKETILSGVCKYIPGHVPEDTNTAFNTLISMLATAKHISKEYFVIYKDVLEAVENDDSTNLFHSISDILYIKSQTPYYQDATFGQKEVKMKQRDINDIDDFNRKLTSYLEDFQNTMNNKVSHDNSFFAALSGIAVIREDEYCNVTLKESSLLPYFYLGSTLSVESFGLC